MVAFANRQIPEPPPRIDTLPDVHWSLMVPFEPNCIDGRRVCPIAERLGEFSRNAGRKFIPLI